MSLTLDLQSFHLPNGDNLIIRVSAANDGASGNGQSSNPVFSSNGHYVVFESYATNLVAGDTNGRADIFRKDLLIGEVVRVSMASDDVESNDGSYNAQVSADGRYVVFESYATNLVAGDTNGKADIFRKDLLTGEVVRVSMASDDAEGDNASYNAQVSADGRYVIFESPATNLVAGDTNGGADIFRKDLLTGEVVRVSMTSDDAESNDGSYNARVSADERYVVFESDATNLVAGDTNGSTDIFRKDLLTGEVVRVSMASDGAEGNESSDNAQVSADGRYVVFESDATNLVAGDTNGSTDIFRKDLLTGEVVRVSMASDGAEANSDSSNAQVSADGRYIVFESYATNFVATGDTNNASDIFRKDLLTGEVVRLSTTVNAASGKEGANASSEDATVSADGRYLMFESDATNLVAGDTNDATDIFRKDLLTGEIVRISALSDDTESNGSSFNTQVSGDGRYVVFESQATNLVAGDTNNRQDIFGKDLATGTVVCVSSDKDGVLGNGDSYNAQVSADGRYVVFESYASNLVENDTNFAIDIFRKDLETGAITRVSTTSDGGQAASGSLAAQLSADGRFVLFESGASNLVTGDTNNTRDIFRKDMLTGEVVRISTATDGTQANQFSSNVQVSGDGNYVVFESYATNLVAGDANGQRDIFGKDLATGTVACVSSDKDGVLGNGDSYNAQVSADGRYVVFESYASNLVENDTNDTGDIFRKDLVTGDVVCVSVSTGGTQANSNSAHAQISADGRYVVFDSNADNLVAGDINGSRDIFRKDLVTGELVRLSTTNRDAQGNEQASGDSSYAQIRLDGHFVVFESEASNLVPGDANGESDIILVDASLAQRQAMLEGRFVDITFGVGAASSVSVAWGDGVTDTEVPIGGTVNIRHAYETRGLKSATVAVQEGDQTWAVPYTIDLPNGAMARDTALADTLSGGSGADKLLGDAYANVLIGHGGSDTLDSGVGSDTLDGGDGGDHMDGGAGDDTYIIDSADDVVIEAADGGTDTAIVSLDFNLAALANVEILKLADGTPATRVSGGNANDHLIGNTNFNLIDGGAGADTMEGGAGSDVFVVDNAFDIIVEAPGGGVDSAQTSVSYALAAGAEVEYLTAMGAARVSLSGNAFANILTGNAAVNTLKGDAGNDRLAGKSSKDVLYGGIGKDLFVFDTKLNPKTNVDKIMDFKPKDDSFYLENAIFKALGRKGSLTKPAKLDGKMFWSGPAAHDADDRIIYNKKTGALYYDQDGTGGHAQVQFATLKKGVALTKADFFVI